MKRIFLSLLSLLIILPVVGQDKLSSFQKKVLLEKVQEYCNLLKDFSSNIEKIDLIDTIYVCCENERVQTYDDLQNSTTEKGAESSTLPLFQYLQNVTFQYDNELQLSFSDFKCETTIDEPITSTDVRSYATVHVKKTIKGANINKSVNELIKVNLENYKISGTIHEDFENSEYVYLKALEQYQEKKYDRALELFRKCTNSTIFAGRYRAMTMIGRIFVEKGKIYDAKEWLTKASEQDPSASLLLASIYLGKLTNGVTYLEVPLQIQNKTLGLELLERNVDNVDADYPEIAAQAMVTLAGIYIQGTVVPRNDKKFFEILNKLYYSFLTTKLSYLSTFSATGLMASYFGIKEDYMSAYKIFDMLQRELNAVHPEFQPIIAAMEQQKEIFKKAMNNVDVNVSQEYSLAYELVNKKEYEKAIAEFKKLADKGDMNACVVMFYYYSPWGGVAQNDFDRYLLSLQDKNKKKALSYLRKAAEKGHVLSYRMLGAISLIDDETRDIDESIKWTLLFEDNTVFAVGQTLAGLYTSFTNERPEFKSIIMEKLKKYTSTSGAANYMLSKFYKENDHDLYNKYIEDGCQFGYFPCLYTKTDDCIQANNLIEAEQMAMKLIERGYPSGYVFKGKIEEIRGNYKNAYDCYMIGYDKNLYDAAIALAKMYHDGKYVDKNFEKAKQFIQQSITWAKEAFDDEEVKNAEELLAQWEQEATNVQESDIANNNQPVDNADIIIAKNLEQLTDASLDPEKKIELSESLASMLFESNSSVVKTVSSNGSTVIATQKVEDFMLQLISYSKQISITVVNKEIGNNGKIKSLSVILK